MDHSEVKHFPKVDHTPADLDKVSTLLLKAAALIEKEGWIQGKAYASPGHQGGPMCMFGAIRRCDWSPIAYEAESRVNDNLGCFMAIWNDRPGRTQDEVVSKLRAVALGL